MHLPDMLRVALSISQGKIRSSTILRKLGTESRKNRLYLAFRALGRVVRTIFLLRFMNEEELRRTIACHTIRDGAHRIEVSASLGVAHTFPAASAAGPEDLLAAAVEAMREAESAGGNQLRFVTLRSAAAPVWATTQDSY